MGKTFPPWNWQYNQISELEHSFSISWNKNRFRQSDKKTNLRQFRWASWLTFTGIVIIESEAILTLAREPSTVVLTVSVVRTHVPTRRSTLVYVHTGAIALFLVPEVALTGEAALGVLAVRESGTGVDAASTFVNVCTVNELYLIGYHKNKQNFSQTKLQNRR